ncbi:hypothetical protein ACVWWG_001953 [Bradyrhizobium sp. LB7.2]
MPNRLTREIMERTNEQRRRLGRCLLSKEGFVHAIGFQAQDDRSVDALVVNLVNHIVEPGDMELHSSPHVAPKVDDEIELNTDVDVTATVK